MQKHLFISYGHDEHASLALQLRDDLKVRGHEVWFDEERLQPGHDWEAFIEEGLKQLAADKANGAVVLLLTPHAVRRPDGYCLNEVASALGRGLRIIPLMVVESEPPLSICRIQWLDMRQCIPIHEKKIFYKPRFDRLLKAVEENQLDFEGNQQRLLKALQPLEFDADILSHLPKFTGRQWVFDAIQQWLAQNPPKQRLFWISGGPGVGKTALSAMLSSRYLEVAALHLCKFGHTQKSDPRCVVASIAYQLSTQLPDYEARLTSMDVERLAQDEPHTMFDNLLVQPLEKLNQPNHPIVILIDALDEATKDGRNTLASFIATEFPKTPPWLRLIITSRPEKAVTAPLQGLDPFILDTETEDNRADIRDYLQREMATFIEGRSDAAHLVEQVLDKSEGVFLYVERVCHDLQHGYLSVHRLDRFPQGLGGVFWQFFERQFPDLERFRKDIRPALRAILAARESLPLDILQHLFGWQDEELRDFVRTLGSLFPVSIEGGQDVIKPYHKELAQWLADEARAGLYYVSIGEGHSLLGTCGMEAIRSGAAVIPAYWGRHTLYHLQKCGRDSDAASIANDKMFRALRVQLGLKNLFLSYSLDAVDATDRLIGDLERLGHTVWRRRASGWVEDEYSVNSADAVIAVLSTRSVRPNSRSFKETLSAVSEGKIVLPVKVQRLHLPVPLHLARRQYVDMASSSYETGLLEVQRFLEGRDSVQQIVVMRQQQFGPDDLRTLDSLQELAAVLVTEGDLRQAEIYYAQVLKGRKRRLGDTHPETLNVMRAIAGLRVAQGDLMGATELHREVLTVRESVLGSDHPDTLESVYDLAVVLEGVGSDSVAEALYRRALAGFDRSLGPEHPFTAQSLNNLAGLLSRKGDYEGAEPLYHRALAIWEQVLGPEHPDMATSLNSLAELLEKKGEYDGAEQLFRRALAIREKVLGLDHPMTRTIQGNLDNLLKRNE